VPRPRPSAFSNEVTYRVGLHLRARADLFGAKAQDMRSIAGGVLRPKLEVVNKAASGPAELRIYDAIGGWFGITATDVAEALDDIDDDRDLKVRINSPGGDVFDGTAIYNLLRTRAGQVDVVVDGLAASAASFIAQAGDTITMNRGTQMMIHDAIGFTIGNASDHREQVALLDRISDEIAGIYAARAGHDVATWREKMLATTWYSASEAVDAGLADETSDDQVETDDEDLEDREAAASTPLRIVAQVTAPPQEADGEPAELTDDEWTALGGALRAGLDETFDGMDGYDPALVSSLIADVYGNAPAPPTIDPGPPPARTSIPLDEFIDGIVQGIQEGVRP
jgi:ATP-dependent protease ClpP protease subunit